MLKLALIFAGLFAIVLIVWHAGPERIYDAAAQLGPVALIAVLIPSTIMYVIEAYGWKVTLGPSAKDIPFWRVFAIKTAGEVVNLTTPAGYIGGEPFKAYLLTKHHVPMVEGLASVVIAKTTKTIAEVLFILLGITLAFWRIDNDGSLGETVVAALVSVALLFFVTASLVYAQRRGFFTWLLEFTRKIGLRIRFLEAREEKIQSLDRMIVDYYRHNRTAVYSSTGLFFLSWMAEAFEVYLIIWYLGGPAMVLYAISINALSVFIKGGSFFIPGSLGAQDIGNFFLLKDFGYSDVAGVTFALVRRYRELVWIGVGLLCLVTLRGRSVAIQGGDSHGSETGS
jgi:glycosyltransferase 2 family protein